MLSIKSLVEKLGVFERNKVPLELKVLAWHSTSSCQASRGLLRPSPRYRASKTAARKWVRKLSERTSIEPFRMPRRLVALDEECVKVNGLEYWVYAP
jgi:transposase-like protein